MKDLKLMTGLSFMLTLLLFNCATPSSLLQDGDYDEAVVKAVKNLRKNKKKKEKDIIVVEEAFRKITSRDMREIEALEAEGQASNWVRINELHNKIKDRQDLIYPYLPLISTKTRYKADFRFVQIVPLEIESRKKAAEYYYVNGKNQLNAAHGNKQAARSAFTKFAKVNNYFDDYKDNRLLMDEAYELGLDKVILEMRNSSFAFIPLGFEEQLLAFNERNLDNQWTHYFKPNNAPADIDYKVIVDITDIDVSPEQVSRDRYELTKELTRTEKVKVQVEQTLPTLIDSTGNNNVTFTKTVLKDVEVPYTVVANITDVYQSKSAFVQARVSFYEANSKTLIDSDYVNATIDFENISTTFRGDRRALNAEARSRIGGSPVQFPTDSELVFEAAAQLKGKITDSIRGTGTYAVR